MELTKDDIVFLMGCCDAQVSECEKNISELVPDSERYEELLEFWQSRKVKALYYREVVLLDYAVGKEIKKNK